MSLTQFSRGKTGSRALNALCTALDAALALLAPLASPTFTGTATAAALTVTGTATAGTLTTTGTATAATLSVTGTATVATLAVTGATTLATVQGTVQALAAAGAVNLTTLVTTIASAGAIALTLADGANGQVKVISMITDGGDATLTPAHLQGGSTLTFNDVGDTVTLVFVGTKWAIIGNTGATLA